MVQAKRRTPVAQKHKLDSTVESISKPVIKNSESNIALDPSHDEWFINNSLVANAPATSINTGQYYARKQKSCKISEI